MCEMNQQAVRAAKDDLFFNSFVRKNELFILKCASETTKRYLTKNDDEWAVALGAFSQAVKAYSADRGSFSGFAKLVIRRKLIDYIRSQAKFRAETAVSLSTLDSDPEESEENATVSKAVLYQSERAADDSLKMEIECAGQDFSRYGFSFFDLTKCSPKAEKTKKACAKVIACIVSSSVLVSEMRRSRCLPIKTLEKNSGVPRKILERHRKYIIAGVEIMTGDYPFLAGYMRYVREELNR
ncbi:RNA polymerase sigma factor SigI7 [Caprobacter fermentans]|uniref:RNA polymerase sigma factor SigI n=2 Tax=Caproicibacter fermentans TaxID=2576756 RepID=A0A6N8HUE3_9FIRM|nr:RNA polymerase sigma factor SigI7 [Caproicibacter fermentans]QNK41522.1 RNA polymerase subunit sigma [Caproicibacter fermentans]